MACEEKTFSDVNEAKMAYIRTELRGLGLTVPETEAGMITSLEIGVEAQFQWSREAGTLAIQIFQKPIFIPCGFIYGRLSASIAQYREA
jgi:hypothetical protein